VRITANTSERCTEYYWSKSNYDLQEILPELTTHGAGNFQFALAAKFALIDTPTERRFCEPSKRRDYERSQDEATVAEANAHIADTERQFARLGEIIAECSGGQA
jgi:hypothetical protein